jgi:hypothetical protein
MSKPLSRLGKQLEEAIGTLTKIGARFALIGGLALAPHKVVRATQDVDLLIDADLADTVDRELKALGYQCLHRTADAANYLRGDQRLDFLYAHRPTARQFLQSARELQTPFGPLHVVSAEGLIAFKLQGLVNNPRRTQDLEDIRALIRANRDTLKLAEDASISCCLIARRCWRRFCVSLNDRYLLASDGGSGESPGDSRDPFEALDDLMQVVESLCPTYPERETFPARGIFKL